MSSSAGGGSRARGAVLDAVLLAAWVAAITAVVGHERGLLGRGAVNPATLLRAGLSPAANEQWFGVYYQGQAIGFAKSMVLPGEFEGMPGIQLVDQGELMFTLLGEPQRVVIQASGFVDANWRLQRLKASVQAGAYELNWSGARIGDTLEIHATSGHAAYDARLYDPTGAAFTAGLVSWTAFHHLREGQWGRFILLDPLALRPDEAFFHVRRRERLDGEDALVVETEFHGMTTTAWVTPDGRVLRESSPLGWELRRITSEEAIRLKAQPPAMDLLTTTAVPLAAPLPQERARMVWLLEGLSCQSVPTTGGQRPLPADAVPSGTRPSGRRCVVELRQVQPPTGPPAAAASPPPPSRYLQPSAMVQSDDPRILEQARAIAGTATDPWLRAQALEDWVHRTLTKRLTVGLPNAVDVLLSQAGDCHEHTALFGALARSLGIPTRLLAGVVAYQGRLFYHAWPEVWIRGQWVPMDPTLGQAIADSTHLALVEADNEQLVTLSQWVGQLTVRPLSGEAAHAE